MRLREKRISGAIPDSYTHHIIASDCVTALSGPKFLVRVLPIAYNALMINSDNNPGVCADKLRLMADYQAETAKFSAMLSDLQRRLGVLPKPEYDELLRLVEVSRMNSERARLELEKHVADHCC